MVAITVESRKSSIKFFAAITSLFHFLVGIKFHSLGLVSTLHFMPMTFRNVYRITTSISKIEHFTIAVYS